MKRSRTNRIRTPAEVHEEFKRRGISITAWSVAHGFSPNLVQLILSGRRNPMRGESHRIAVTLGIKEGEIVSEDPRKAMEAA